MHTLPAHLLARYPAHDAARLARLAADSPVQLVESGAVDVFVQRREEDGATAGARHHLYRAGPGELVFGCDPAAIRRGTLLITAALPGTRVAAFTLEALCRTASEVPDDGSEQLAALLDRWVNAVTASIDAGALPKACVAPVTGATMALAAGEALSPLSGIVWTQMVSGNMLWLGRYECALSAARHACCALTRSQWLQAEGPAELRCLRAEDLLDPARVASAVALLQQFLWRDRLTAIESAARSERARLSARADRSVVLTQEALARLVSVGRGDTSTPRRAQQHDSLFAALDAVGAGLGVEFRPPTSADQRAFGRDPVGTLALCSGVRHRRVALRDRWWQADGGPLLATLREGGGWVALLRKGARYELFDPVSAERTPMNADVAATLEPFAWSFYRPFPAHALGIGDLVRFGGRGLTGDFAWMLVLGALIGVLGLVVPIASGVLIDSMIPSADIGGIWQMVGALLAIAVANATFSYAQSLAIVRVEGRMDASLQSAVWDRVLKLPAPFFRSYTSGDLSTRINGISQIRQGLSGSATGTLLSGLFSLTSFAMLLYYSVPLAMVALAFTAVAMTVTVALGLLRIREERVAVGIAGDLSGLVYQYLRGVSRLRVSAAENRAFANWARLFTDLRRRVVAATAYANWLRTFFAGFGPASTAVLFATLGWAVMAAQTQGTMPAAQISTGQFIAFSAAFGGLLSAMTSFAETAIDLLRLIPVYERARPVLEALPEVDERKTLPGELQGEIEVAGVAFRYGDGPEILRAISFTVPAGGYIALVGASGSGKSTMLRLLLGFEHPMAGSIYFDGQDLSDLDITAVRRQLGVVLQSGQLMAGDIFTNIVGATQLTLDDAWEAARLAGLEEDINALPMGMHTLIGEGTATLSGGQRQRILIARALVHRPRIVLFDEATSALDNRTQAIVTESLTRMKATRIVVAHRLSTIMHADRILVLRDGKIVQDGSYQALMAVPGPFADLARRQIA